MLKMSACNFDHHTVPLRYKTVLLELISGLQSLEFFFLTLNDIVTEVRIGWILKGYIFPLTSYIQLCSFFSPRIQLILFN